LLRLSVSSTLQGLAGLIEVNWAPGAARRAAPGALFFTGQVDPRVRTSTSSDGPRDEQQRQEKHRVLRMEFKTFLNAFMRLPCQIVHTSRQLIYRLLGWSPWSGVFFRLVDRLHG
jgi:hypothetical protein